MRTPLREAPPPPPRPNRLGPILLRWTTAAFVLVCLSLDAQIVRSVGIREEILPMLLHVLLLQLEAYLAIVAAAIGVAAVTRRRERAGSR